MASRRDEITDAALAQLARDGPSFSFDALAAQTGASKALLFHHFGTRQGLLDAMAERVLRATQQGLDLLADEHPEPRARLVALARALLAEPPDNARETRHVVQFWLLDDARGSCRGALRDALVSDFIAASLREARVAAPPRDVAALVLARWHGATVAYASGGAVDFDREQERLVADLAALR